MINSWQGCCLCTDPQGGKTLTSTEDAELLSGGDEVEVCGEEVHERSGIHHEHKHPEAVHSHLLPARTHIN